MDYRAVTLAARPDLAEQLKPLNEQAWPEFMRREGVALGQYWPSLFSTFSSFQILFADADNRVLAVGHTIPFVWNGTTEDLPPGIDQVLEDTHRSVGSRRRCWRELSKTRPQRGNLAVDADDSQDTRPACPGGTRASESETPLSPDSYRALYAVAA